MATPTLNTSQGFKTTHSILQIKTTTTTTTKKKKKKQENSLPWGLSTKYVQQNAMTT